MPKENPYDLNNFRLENLERFVYPFGKGVGLGLIGLGILSEHYGTILVGIGLYGLLSLRQTSWQNEIDAKRFNLLEKRLKEE